MLSDSYINTQNISCLYTKAYARMFANSLYNVNTKSSLTEKHPIYTTPKPAKNFNTVPMVPDTS